jgi:RNA polymerase sigma-70 factor, ECF subfamily
VYAFVAGLVRDRAAAEEVTAAAFERALRRRATYSPERGSARGWLFGIARNAAYDELRRRARAAPLVAEERTAAGEEGVEETALRRVTVAAALAQLDDEDRELVALKFEAGLANGEIAETLGISESNVGTRLCRVVAKLRRAVA